MHKTFDISLKLFLMSTMAIASMAFPLNNNRYENFQFFNTEPIDEHISTNNYTFEKIGFQSFVEVADCMKEFKTRGVLFRDCENVMYNNNNYEKPSFFAYICDHENNVTYTTKYFAKSEDPSYIYVTYVPVGCYNKQLKVPKVSYSHAYDYFKSIPEITENKTFDGKKVIRFTDFWDKFNCKTYNLSRADYDATSMIKIRCHPNENMGFKYLQEIKFIPDKSELDTIQFLAPICKENKVLHTEVVDFKVYENNEELDYTMRVPVSCR